jgi:ubiquitin-protein ligase E3 C
MEDRRLEEETADQHVPEEATDSEDEEHGVSRSKRHAAASKSAFSRRQIAYFSPRLGLLNNIPFVIPFDTRVSVFRRLVLADKEREQQNDRTGFFGFGGRGNMASIRRDHLADDGFIHLHNLGGSGLKKRLQIQFVDEYGMPETGIDGGGLFKEFLTALGKEAFDTNRGLWKHNSNQEVYPAAHTYARERVSIS